MSASVYFTNRIARKTTSDMFRKKFEVCPFFLLLRFFEMGMFQKEFEDCPNVFSSSKISLNGSIYGL